MTTTIKVDLNGNYIEIQSAAASDGGGLVAVARSYPGPKRRVRRKRLKPPKK